MKQIWQQQVQIFPLLATILLLDIFGFLRKLRPLPYAPLYFSAYPLNELNGRVAKFYEEIDPQSGTSETPNVEELVAVKKRAMREGIFSFLLAALGVPLLAGFAAAFFLRKEDLSVFIFILFLYKLLSTIHAIRNFEKDTLSNYKSRWIVFSTYLVYICVLCWTFHSIYFWSYPFIAKGDYSSMANEAINFLMTEIILKGLILVALGTFFVNYLIDKDTRIELSRERAS